MQKKKLWIIIGSVLLVLIVLAIVLPITLLSSNKKLKLNLTFESQTIIYDGKLHSLEIEGEIPKSIEISYENNGHKDVGTYEVIAHIKDTKTSYPDMKATLTILPFSSQNVEFKDVTIPYDGNTHSIYVLGNIPEDVSVTYENNDKVNVGSYEVTAHFNYTGNNCENLVDLKATLTIEKVQLDLSTILFESQSFTYDGTDKFLEISSQLPNGVLVTYENNGHKDAGTYEVTATFSDPLGNYIITGSKTATLTIKKATYDMSLVHFTSIEIPYDGLEHELLIDGTLPDGVSVLRYIDNKRTELGQTICTVEFSYDEKNYNPIPAMTATLTIVQGTMDFLQQTEFYTVYNGSPQSIDIGNLPEGVTVTYENNSHTVAGSYQVTAHFKDVYERYKDKTMILTLIIQKANYDLSNVVFEDEIFIYDGNSHSLSIKGKLPQGVEVTYSENTLTEIGRLEVIASFTIPDSLNYNPIPEKVAYLIIVPEKLDSVYLEDETFSYDGKYHSLTLHGELPLGVTYEFINNSQKEVGDYEVIVRFNVKEYGELKATLTITKADIDMSNVFFHGATFVYDGKEHTLTIDGDLPEMVKVSYQNNSRIDIGRQTATAIFEVLEPEHYNELPNLYAELVIVDNHLTGISFQDSTVVYDRLEHSIFIEGELPYGVTVSYTNNGQKNAGTYLVTAHFHDSTGQYQNLEDMTAKLTILKANFAKNGIIFVSRTFTYDGTTKSLEIYCDDIPEDIIVKYENNDHINAGTYTVIVSFIDLGDNYNPVEPIEATLTIKRAIVNLDHIIFKNEEYEYDGFEHTLTIHGALPAGVRVSYTPNSLTKLGRILVTARFIVDEKNYEPIPSRTAYLTITKGALENITLKDKTVVYDGNVHSLVIEGNLPSGVNVEYQNNDQTNAGVYEVIADFYDAEGYYNSLTAYLTISKAVYDMSDISFQSVSYVYDGVPHTLVITGILPEGVTVIYSANTLTNAGTLLVTARFIGNPNYEDIPSMQATLTIEKIVITGISFEGATFTYDGTPHSIYVTGIEDYPIRILYYNNGKINAGEHEVIASFVLLNDNYASIEDMTALLTISPIPLKPVALEDQTFILDGTEHFLSITAELPEGVYAVYENNGQIYEGTYVVKMHLESQTPNYILPEPVTATLTIASDGSYHTVIFHISDTIEDVRIVKDNEGIEDIPIPAEISGYDGYFEGDFSHITSRMEFYPVYTESQFTIFFDSDSVESLSVKYLASYTLPIPTKQDYLFKRWVDEAGNEITDGTYLWTSSITLYSVWQCEVSIQNVNDYIYEEIVLDSNDYVVPTYPYSSYLEGFYLDKELTIPFDLTKPVQANQTLYTKYVYDFDFILNESNEVEVLELLDNTKEFYNLETPIYDLYPIVSIPDGIFAGCSNIKEIHIPALNDEFGMLFGTEIYENSVPVVQRQGTYYLPSNLNIVKVASTSIPTFSFLNCNSITKLILENVEAVEGFAFQDCFGITELYLSNCQNFAEGAFRGCSSLNKVYCNSLEDWLNLSFVDYLSTPMAYASELYVQDILIKEFDLSGKEAIGDYQFYGLSQMEELHIPDVETIGNQAFMGCSSLNTLWLSQSLESCYSEAFAAVGSLESIYYDGTLESWSKIIFHDQYATPMLYSPKFYGKIDEDYQLISEISLSSEISSIGDYQFYGFTNITDISFQNVRSIGNKAFASMGNVESFYMPNTIEQIEEDAFSDTSILNVHYVGTLEEWANIQFLNANSTPLCSNASNIFFDNSIDLENIVLSSSIETIGNYQFYGFKTTKSFESSAPLASIGQNAFANCVELESFSFNSTEDTILMENAFLGCTGLKNVYFKGSLDAYMKLTYKNRAANPLYYKAVLWINNSLVEEVTVHENLEDYQFYGLTSLKKVTLDSSVKSIGKYAFANCTSLTEIIGSNGINLIGDSAFEGATSLAEISLTGVTSIPNSCFRNCKKLTNIEIPLVTSIGASAFSGCSSLATIDLSQIEQIGNSAFYGCGSLKKISIQKVTKLEYSTFFNCYGLESVTLSNSLTHIAYFAFYGCTKLAKIIIPTSVKIIEGNAFSDALNVIVYAMQEEKPSSWRTNWDKGTKGVYWYSELSKEGNYWHFDDDLNCVIW